MTDLAAHEEMVSFTHILSCEHCEAATLLFAAIRVHDNLSIQKSCSRFFKPLNQSQVSERHIVDVSKVVLALANVRQIHILTLQAHSPGSGQSHLRWDQGKDQDPATAD
jgi:hypothetical protein